MKTQAWASKQDSKEPNQLHCKIRCIGAVKESARAIHTRANTNHAQIHIKYIRTYTCTYVYKNAGKATAGWCLLHMTSDPNYLPGLQSWLLFGQLTTHWSTRTHESLWAHLRIYVLSVGFSIRTSRHPQDSPEIFNCWYLLICFGRPQYQAVVVEFLGNCAPQVFNCCYRWRW